MDTYCYCYPTLEQAQMDFEKLKAADLPNGGRVELRESHINVPYKYWVVCVKLTVSSYHKHLKYDDRAWGTPEKFQSEGRLIETFDT